MARPLSLAMEQEVIERPAAAAMPQAAGRLSGRQIADRLAEAADLLEAQCADRFRGRAYRRAADTVRGVTEEPAAILARSGLQGLIDLPAIGPGPGRSRLTSPPC